MEVIRHAMTFHRCWRRADAAGTDYCTATSKGDSQAKAPSAQTDFPRTVQVATSGFTSSAEVTVTVTGKDAYGDTITDAIVVPSAGTTTQGVKAFTKITQIDWTAPAGWTAGTFKVQSGTKFGLCVPSLAQNVTAVKEIYYDDTASPPNPGDVATLGTVDATNLTYTPNTALNVAAVIELYGTFTLHHILVP